MVANCGGEQQDTTIDLGFFVRGSHAQGPPPTYTKSGMLGEPDCWECHAGFPSIDSLQGASP